jgi:hypothetical protein
MQWIDAGDDVGDWLNPLSVGALTAEAITVAIYSIVLLRQRSAVLQPADPRRASPLASGSA